jgi:nucleotide-binding universal stress UspA family protein
VADQIEGALMFHKVLIGYDGSDQSEDALALGRLLAAATGADLVVAGIVPQDPLTGGRDVLFAESDAELLHKVEQAAEPIAAEPLTMPGSSPACGLCQLAESLQAGVIVVGSSHRGRFGRAIAGSVAQRLVQTASCAVAIAPRGFAEAEHELRVIAVGCDGLPESREALADAVTLAEEAGAGLRLLVAVYPSSTGTQASGNPTTAYMEALNAHFRGVLDEALDSVPPRLRAGGKLIRQEVAPALAEEAQRGVDLLCVGSRGYGPLRRVLLGSVSYELFKSLPCPLLVLPHGARHASPGGPAEAMAAASND